MLVKTFLFVGEKVPNLASHHLRDLSKVCSLSEWSFIISVAVSSDHFQLRCTDFVGSHQRESN